MHGIMLKYPCQNNYSCYTCLVGGFSFEILGRRSSRRTDDSADIELRLYNIALGKVNVFDTLPPSFLTQPIDETGFIRLGGLSRGIR